MCQSDVDFHRLFIEVLFRWVHTMNVSSSVGQRLKSLINEPKRRRNYVHEKDIFHSHYERFISGAIQLLRTLLSV